MTGLGIKTALEADTEIRVNVTRHHVGNLPNIWRMYILSIKDP